MAEQEVKKLSDSIGQAFAPTAEKLSSTMSSFTQQMQTGFNGLAKNIEKTNQILIDNPKIQSKNFENALKKVLPEKTQTERMSEQTLQNLSQLNLGFENFSKNQESSGSFAPARTQSIFNLSAKQMMKDTFGHIGDKAKSMIGDNAVTRGYSNIKNAWAALKGNPAGGAGVQAAMPKLPGMINPEESQAQLEENREKIQREEKVITLLEEILEALGGKSHAPESQAEKGKSFMQKIVDGVKDFFSNIPYLKEIAAGLASLLGAGGLLGLLRKLRGGKKGLDVPDVDIDADGKRKRKGSDGRKLGTKDRGKGGFGRVLRNMPDIDIDIDDDDRRKPKRSGGFGRKAPEAPKKTGWFEGIKNLFRSTDDMDIEANRQSKKADVQTKKMGKFGGMFDSIGKFAARAGGIFAAVSAGMDAMGGVEKAVEWNVGEMSAGIGGFLGGTDMLETFSDRLVNSFMKGGEFAMMGAAIGSVVPVVGTVAGGIIGGAIGALMGFIGGEDIAKAMSAIGDWFLESWAAVSKLFEEVWTGYVTEPLSSAIEGVKETFKNFPDFPDFGILDTIKDKFYALRDWVMEMIDMIPSFDDIWGGAEETVEVVGEKLNYDSEAGALENAGNAVRAIKDGYKDATVAGVEAVAGGVKEGMKYVGNLFTGDQTNDARIEAAQQMAPIAAAASGGTNAPTVSVVPKAPPPSKETQETDEGGGFWSAVSSVVSPIGDVLKSAIQPRGAAAGKGVETSRPGNQPAEPGKISEVESSRKGNLPAPAGEIKPPETSYHQGPAGPQRKENVEPLTNLTPAEPTYPNLDAPFFTPVNAKPQAREVIIKEEAFVPDARPEKDYSKIDPATGKKGAPIYWNHGPNKGQQRYFVGYGFNTIDGVPVENGDTISKAKASGVIDTFITDAEDKIRASNHGTAYDNIKSVARKAAILSMAYQVGVDGFLKTWPGTWGAIENAVQNPTPANWEAVAANALDSDAAIQTANRFGRNAEMFTTGEFPGYYGAISAKAGFLATAPTMVFAGDYPDAKSNPEIIVPMNALKDQMMDATERIVSRVSGSYERNNALVAMAVENRIAAMIQRSAESESRLKTLADNNTGQAQLNIPVINNVVDNRQTTHHNQSVLMDQTASNPRNVFRLS